MNAYINVLMSLADKAYKKNEIPVGAVVVFNNKIVSKGYNKKNMKNDITNHAEIIAIKKAARKLKDWRLTNCDLYVTLEPCDMCKEIIRQSRIRNVYYLLDKLDYKKGYSKTKFNKMNIENSFQQKIYQEKLSTFFKDKCKR